MKRWIALLLTLALLCTAVSALANAKNYKLPQEGDGLTLLMDEKDRKIKLNGRLKNGNFPENPVIEGQSPTTGEAWEGRYQPVMVQIGTETAEKDRSVPAGTGQRAPWGGHYADIVYEQPLYRYGPNRITFLFSNHMPDSVGPVRSARVGHVYLREEWGAGLVFVGGPEEKGNNIIKLFKELGANKKGVIFNGRLSGKWKDKYYRRLDGKNGTPQVSAPNNVDINAAGIQSTIPEKNDTPNHVFLFTDESPYDGPLAYTINIDWGHDWYQEHFYYDEMENLYFRYVRDVPYMSFESGVNRDESIPMTFSNLIIQRVEVDYANNNELMPIVKNVAQGNADIFIGGRYIAGYWIRTDVDQRTIFFDSEGNELQLTRGKTFICMLDKQDPVTFSAE